MSMDSYYKDLYENPLTKENMSFAGYYRLEKVAVCDDVK